MNEMIHKAGGWLVFPKASANLRSWARIPARDVFWEKALCVLFIVAQQNIPQTIILSLALGSSLTSRTVPVPSQPCISISGMSERVIHSKRRMQTYISSFSHSLIHRGVIYQ